MSLYCPDGKHCPFTATCVHECQRFPPPVYKDNATVPLMRCEPAKALTEADVRRIVRDELAVLKVKNAQPLKESDDCPPSLF